MNRTDLTVILLVAIMSTVVVFQSIPATKESGVFLARVEASQNKLGKSNSEIIDASYRLAYHCKMAIVESLIIAKTSVNAVLDTTIESLN